jgi:hypothetical protein
MRPAKILPAPRCGWPDRCAVKSISHSPEPGTRRAWGYHDVQCQVPNPSPGPHPGGYPECALIDGHSGDHDYRRHAAEKAADPALRVCLPPSAPATTGTGSGSDE